MLRRYERRLLDEIERHLNAEDPAFARKITDVRPLTRFRAWLSARRTLGITSAILAVLCLLLGDGAGFFTTGALAGALLLLDGWKLQTDWKLQTE
ncbi:DUF3040 domain-containing protein [Saccharopolyspora shandongensis]|uniref:DUF3040 domain-containing protein n=1 Tax=Saccharopolyspora shandongensis TaxID=418495 RepID=UPI00341FB66A